MNRTTAREISVQLIFACANGKRSAEELLDDFFDNEHYCTLSEEDELFLETPEAKQLGYIRRLVSTAEEKRSELDGYIEKYAKGWKLQRISKTALAVLRCALCEILYLDIPPSAAIDEAVELAKGYDEPDTVAFINGVLGGFMKGEFAGDSQPEEAKSEEE